VAVASNCEGDDEVDVWKKKEEKEQERTGRKVIYHPSTIEQLLAIVMRRPQSWMAYRKD
jgi:hypothetical protein